MKRATYRQVAIPPLEVISIHALVKRATVTAVDEIVGHDISIHALVKRATFVKLQPNFKKFRFQSTPS